MKMDGDQMSYEIRGWDKDKFTSKKVYGEVYKNIYGIQVTKTLTRRVCFQITHIPTGALLTQLIFSTAQDAKNFLDWFTVGLEEILQSSDFSYIIRTIKNTKKVKIMIAQEEKFGYTAIKFGRK